MERLTEKFKDGRNILRKGIAVIFHVGFGRFFEGDSVDKLAEYEDLEEKGKLLKLPCAVGDKIYLPNEYVGKVIDFEIVEICIFKEEIMLIDDSENEYFINDFGKTVFPTKEEAEAALKELLEAKNSYSQAKVLKPFANEWERIKENG